MIQLHNHCYAEPKELRETVKRKQILIGAYIVICTILLAMLYPNNDHDDDLYIEILKFGETNLGTPISFGQLEAHLSEKGVEYNEFVAMYLFGGAYVDENNPGGNGFRIPRDSVSFYLHIGGYSELLDYTELQEAKESSSNVLFVAVLAIMVSTLFQILFLSLSMRAEQTPRLRSSEIPIEPEEKMKIWDSTEFIDSKENNEEQVDP